MKVLKQGSLRHWLVFACGVMGTAMGIALITTAGLGSSPVTSFSYALTFIFPGSLGLFSFLVNTSMLVGQMLLLGREFPRFQLLQLPVLLAFSSAIDLWMHLFRGLTTDAYPGKLAVLLLGCAVLGLGIALQVLGHVLILPAEGFVKVVAQKLHKEFAMVKTCYDMTMVMLAVIISLACLGHVAGVREGTVVAALVTGAVSRFFRLRLAFLVREPVKGAQTGR